MIDVDDDRRWLDTIGTGAGKGIVIRWTSATLLKRERPLAHAVDHHQATDTTCRRISREVWRHIACTVRRTQFGRSAGSEDYIVAVRYVLTFQIGTILNALFTRHHHGFI